MKHLLRRHPFAVSAHFRHSLVLTYAFPANLLEPLLPRGLVLDTFQSCGFLAIALVQTRSLRPSILPSALGLEFFLTGYRLFTRVGSSEGARRGLYILRSDTDSRSLKVLGNLFTHYRYHLCESRLQPAEEGFHWEVKSAGQVADVCVNVDLKATPAKPPAGSPFPDLETARRFAGPLPYTFDYEVQTDSIIAVRGIRTSWNPRPVHVEVQQATYLKREPFCFSEPCLANAFYLSDVPYRWERGERVEVKSDHRR